MGLKVASSNLVSGKSSEFDGKKSSSLLSSIKTETNSKQNNQAMMNLTQKIKDGTSQKKDLTVVDFYKEVLERQPFDAENLAKKKVSVVLEGKKPAAQMSLSDYEMAKDRAIFKQAGYSMLTDKEIQMAVAAIKSHGAVNHGSDGLDKLRRIDNQPGVMFTKTDQATIEYAKRAGQAVLQYQQYQAKQTDAIQERNNNYATEALGGFVQPIVNAPVNVLNGISEPFRAGEKAMFGTNYIPEVPRMQVAERSEYWNKDGRLVINRGAEIGATIVFGGAAGGKAIGTQAGRIFLGTESAYNIAAGTIGKDVTQTDEQGNARQMNYLERGLRITGGIFGARQTINTEIAAPNSITNRAVDKLDDIFKNNPTFKPQGEFVTPEGFKVRVPQESALEKMDKPMEMRWENRINLRNGDGAKGSGLVYAWRRHGVDATANKSKFTISLDQLKSILQRKDVIKSVANQSPTSGNYIREVDVGQTIGNLALDKGGQPTSIMTIITDKAGNLVNVFPGTEKFGVTLP